MSIILRECPYVWACVCVGARACVLESRGEPGGVLFGTEKEFVPSLCLRGVRLRPVSTLLEYIVMSRGDPLCKIRGEAGSEKERSRMI